jgi:hypothetical protein
MWILTFNQPPCSYIWFFAEVIVLDDVHPLKICQHTKFQGPTLSGAIFRIHLRSLKIHHRHIKNSVKENNDSNRTSRHVHDLSLYQTSSVWVQRFTRCLHNAVNSLKIISTLTSMVPRWLVPVLNPSHTSEHQPFWNGWMYGIENLCVEVTFNGITSLLNSLLIC